MTLVKSVFHVITRSSGRKCDPVSVFPLDTFGCLCLGVGRLQMQERVTPTTTSGTRALGKIFTSGNIVASYVF